MADDLRARLLGHAFAPDDDALLVHVDTAVAVVAVWLCSEAHELRRLAADFKDRRDDGDPNADYHLGRYLAQAVALEERARSLTQPSTEEKR